MREIEGDSVAVFVVPKKQVVDTAWMKEAAEKEKANIAAAKKVKGKRGRK
jgi:prolyl-tRNA editing enzyme YbaK/EbsC (Cys-tRNA(Pro) deacylase)